MASPRQPGGLARHPREVTDPFEVRLARIYRKEDEAAGPWDPHDGGLGNFPGPDTLLLRGTGSFEEMANLARFDVFWPSDTQAPWPMTPVPAGAIGENYKDLLGSVARSIATVAYHQARIAVEPPNAGQARSLETIGHLIHQGHQQLVHWQYADACHSFRQATARALDLL